MALASSRGKPQIVDVRHDSNVTETSSSSGSVDLRNQIIEGLSKPTGQKTLPTMLLYSEYGLLLYDAITTDCPEYYLFPAEEEILKSHSDDIVRVMLSHGDEGKEETEPVVLELGAGALRKTSHVLLALAKHVSSSPHKYQGEAPDAPLTYFALDLEKAELDRTLSELMAKYGDNLEGKVDAKGMWGTYNDGIRFIQEGGFDSGSLSSSKDAADYLDASSRSNYRSRSSDSDGKSLNRPDSPYSYSTRTFSTLGESITPPSSPGSELGSRPTTRPVHFMFLGSSLGNFDRESATAFLRELPLRPGSGDTLLIGLDHDNAKEQVERAYNDSKGITREFIMHGLKEAGKAFGKEDLFDTEKWEYFNRYDVEKRRHEAYYKSKVDQTLIIPGCERDASILAGEVVNVEISVKFSDRDAHSMFTEASLRPIMRWTDEANRYSLWLLERPVFTFPLLKAPDAFGVPKVDDWKVMWKAWDNITLGMIPQSMLFTKPIDLRHICLFYLGHIPAFLDIHLSRLLDEPHTEPEYFKDIFERGIDPHVDDPNQCHPHSEVPENEDEWPALEQIINFRDRVRARLMRLYDDIATGKRELTRTIGRVLFMTLEHEGMHAETLLYMLLQGAGISGGTQPPPGFAIPKWDLLAQFWKGIESPAEETVTLGPATITYGHDDFESKDNDPSVSHNLKGIEYGWDNEHPKREVHIDEFRIEWRPVSNGQFYEFYKQSGEDKVKLPASWVELDGQIQVRTLYGPVPIETAQNWPMLTSYDDLSKYAQVRGGRLPTEAELRLFFDKFESGYEGGSNVGFRNWHPVPATTGTEATGGKGHNGGVWEWTSTVFDRYDGFEESRRYPGYSSDFFDGKHQVVIGGSYATIPRIAERRSFRNYYQHNYPYPWVAGRVAYDV